MATWLMDTALFMMLASPKQMHLRRWCEANDASLFLATASLTEISAGIAKTSARQPQRGNALRVWFDDVTSSYADRIHLVDAEIAVRAGALMSRVKNGAQRHRAHDAVLVATAQAHGHGLLTRRDGIFGAWTNVPIAVI